MISRRELLKLAGLATATWPVACRRPAPVEGPVVLNDIHSKLNPSRVRRVERPASVDELAELIRAASGRGQEISVAGGRHAMGGQQFGTDTLHVDTRGMNRVLNFDATAGTIEVEAGIEWPELIDWCLASPRNVDPSWGIVQKQTGADRMTIGGALAANVHGRGLALQPIVGDVESFTLIDANGRRQRCSRSENTDLFGLAVGGYGLFGVIVSVTLRLTRRVKLERVVEVRSTEGLSEAFEERIAAGFLYGDFQFKTDEAAPDFLQTGVFSCYRPIQDQGRRSTRQRRLPRAAWKRLLDLAHFDKGRAFEEYVDYYLTTSGQVYWSDSHQLSAYLDDYHSLLDRRSGASVPGSEMITEVYVPRAALGRFMSEAAEFLLRDAVPLIYGTIRLIETDDVTFLPWAKERWACIVLNLHVDHDAAGIERAKGQFRRLIDLAIAHGGSFYLTYHRWAAREQLDTCYPEMAQFMSNKLAWDSEELFQSDWYRHYRTMYAT